ncbi:hypothetical protein [Caballeronia sp. LZ029]
MVYLAKYPTGALLETLVHQNPIHCGAVRCVSSPARCSQR